MKAADASVKTHVIEARSGWRLVDLGELWEYRDLFSFMVWRDIKGRYAQSVLGFGWAVLQPVLAMVVFTVIFGRLLKVDSEGVPYAIFSYAALVPWSYFSSALTGASSSLVQNSAMLSKVYFPRLVLPLASVLARLVDFGVALIILFALMARFKIVPTAWVVTLPLLILVMTITAAGTGMWLTALAVQFRDVRFGMIFGVQLLMYCSPVIYPASMIPDRFRLLYGLNPMTGIIEGFRSALLGTNSMPWDLLAVGAVVSAAIGISGLLYFKRMERVFADVV